jgi:hypothetical protein
VECIVYQQWRDEALEQLISKTILKLDLMKIENPIRTNILSAAKSLFADDPMIWPLHLTMYYLGQIPNLDTFIPFAHSLNKITLIRLKTHISSDWHISSIRLAGRIFGDYQRRMAVLMNIPRKKSLSSFSYNFTSNRQQ